jgi:hypothetical protein
MEKKSIPWFHFNVFNAQPFHHNFHALQVTNSCLQNATLKSLVRKVAFFLLQATQHSKFFVPAHRPFHAPSDPCDAMLESPAHEQYIVNYQTRRKKRRKKNPIEM